MGLLGRFLVGLMGGRDVRGPPYRGIDLLIGVSFIYRARVFGHSMRSPLRRHTCHVRGPRARDETGNPTEVLDRAGLNE